MTTGKPTPDSLPKEPLPRLLAVMGWLRDRQHGCPWDIDQTFRTIAPYTIEEAYEVADAIERDDMPALKEELGDLLLQVVYHSQIASESKSFAFDDVAAAIADKMVDRHPHVFGDMDIKTADAQTVSWEARKAAERAAKGATEGSPGALDGVARALPALMRAEKIQKRAARVGFDWATIGPVIDKIEEELQELRVELEAGKIEQEKVSGELGDVLFAVANLARHCKVDPEVALRATNDKFEKRFRHIERRLAESGRKPSDASLEEMEALWQEAKTRV
ncbi:nucleoside triphosphate pyrophosphohydrolase [Reyranella sp.]|jgi:ATP diphosphatase|uniref:nucleoside triphosphate pyrophosphohydrolase n=1 Tax=Reyranella sp. TaxID=1929291 RepID=UPI000BCFAF96|nr:nucleoside triphosphate pyrophosphohydrolase [Reyranella sp.]OYY45838.1 MAG: nucleoside triphosphate pyrophosphohydrolase [Rhodospirillales bacterium 35-66-84]OYZ96219.1 MAG: nucleoside triphosphate pyrophosphohydrolase [Rhodospirillales bacterium 24-66-33]OZB28619.1 MAG: nucleoside triphosphate pyrophosphohydrolase [Rhodospirillales bacterium 39-66-50]HQS14156.1 nucleoside triphosphate pyrophosphohydrolase [Reyranella sp.]HQT11152.1 nucleoside triphosphate pyrophosphohydrolase [Reyranella 